MSTRTTYTRHELSSLREAIKTSTTETREGRIKARDLVGTARWSAQRAAIDYDSRVRLLAYGFLRGKSMRDMESETSRPENLPGFDRIRSIMERHASEGDERLAALLADAEADYNAWEQKILSNFIVAEASRTASAFRKFGRVA